MTRIKRRGAVVLGLLLPPFMVAMELDWDETSKPLQERGFLSSTNIFDHRIKTRSNSTTIFNSTEEDADPFNATATDSPTIDVSVFPDIGVLGPESLSYNPCGISVNATPQVCTQRIAESGRTDCDCYNFCEGDLVGCYAFGDDVPSINCPIQDIVVGCQGNYAGTLLPVGGQDEPCPPGYMCSKYEQQSCDVIREIPIVLGLGDVHAGLYCPGRADRTESGYENCDVGYYCPDSTTRIPCPAGYFCPHKTARPAINCRGCPEGATSLRRPSFAYTIMVLMATFMVIVVVWRGFKQYNGNRHNQLDYLQRRNLNGVKDIPYQRKHLRRMKALWPELRLVEKRLRQQYGYNIGARVVIVDETEDGKIIFHAGILFDVLDTLGSDAIPYTKLNKVLKLTNAQLGEFIRRMNDAAGEPAEHDVVQRHVFITQFLHVFETIRQLDPTPEQAAALFDEIAKQGTTSSGEIPHRLFYTSRMADFLTETQINVILKKFQRTKEFQDFEEQQGELELHRIDTKEIVAKKVPLAFRFSHFGLPERGFSIGRADFIARYPTLLAEATKPLQSMNSMIFTSQLTLHKGVDIAFKNLSVSVNVKDRPVRVVNSVTGRLCDGTMTALMGGPGSGKRSLLSALSGRAFQSGTVTGIVKINGHVTTLAKHSGFVGFMPEDDTLYPDLTVREHLIFSGKFRLREGTSLEEIEDWADSIMASLNLCSAMHTVVGHQHRGGLSDLKRKSLSLGLELMAKPRIVFLEHPTSGLKPSSALEIVRTLKKLADLQGITVCAALDQPRPDCLELFDSVLLLGSAGKLVYNGPVTKMKKYFKNLNYNLPGGESLTNWVIDIATGRLTPPVKKRKRNKEKAISPSGSTPESPKTIEGSPQVGGQTASVKKVTFEIAGRILPAGGEKDNVASMATKPFDGPSERAKATCEMLSDHLREHINGLSKKKRLQHEAPMPYPLPRSKKKPSFMDQLGWQLQRLLILVERTWFLRFFDLTIIVVAVILVTLMDGVAQPTEEINMGDLSYESVSEPVSVGVLLAVFPKLFSFATTGIRGDIEMYATRVGVVFALIVCVTSTKVISNSRSAFLREAASGYSTGAFFLATNVWVILENSVQAILASLFAYCIRNSLSAWYTFVVNFLLLAWTSASWGLLWPLLVPKQHALSATGVFVVFFGLLFCGVIPPITFEVIYDNAVAAIASGLLSPTRFFVEAMAVAEARCLPVQSGFTEIGSNLRGEALQVASFKVLNYGLNDFGNVTQQSRRGWYWGALPAIVIGFLLRWLALGALYASKRSRQGKRSIQYVVKRHARERRWFYAYGVVLVGLLSASVYAILRHTS